MKLRSVFFLSVMLAAVTAPASADVPAELQGFAGKWSCTLTQGTTKFNSTMTASLWGNWILEQISFAAGGGYPASTGTAFLGRDPKTKRWVYGEFDSVGEYFVTTSGSPSVHDSMWKAAYPPMDGTTNIRTIGKNQYTVESTLRENGKEMSFKQVCNRM